MRDRYHNNEVVKNAKREAQWRRYGLIGATVDLYARLVSKQDNRCGMCGSPPGKKGLSWDHEHRTGKPRDLLCTPCNTALTHLENPEFMRIAQAYLTKHEVESVGSMYGEVLCRAS